MNSRVSVLLPRVVMYIVMLAVILYVLHFLWPTVPPENGTDEIALNPVFQVGLYLALALLGALVGFWITFGDLINREDKNIELR